VHEMIARFSQSRHVLDVGVIRKSFISFLTDCLPPATYSHDGKLAGGRTMRWIRLALIVLAAALMWSWASSIRDGFVPVLMYAIAGAATGIAVGTTARAFASVSFTLISTIVSGALGLLFLTPMLAVLMAGSDSNTGPLVILLLCAAALAAIAGAVWGVLDRMSEAYDEWRHTERRGLTLGGAHR
jgi:hypothetical protein